MKRIFDALKTIVPLQLRQRVKRDIIDYFQIPSMEWSFRNLRRLGFDPHTIVDIGAYKGEWTLMTRQIFPEASFLMLEAQESRRTDLEAVKQMEPAKIHYRIA